MAKMDRLAAELTRITGSMFQFPITPPSNPMGRELAITHKAFGGIDSMGPSPDRIADAVTLFRRTEDISSFNELKLCCCGIATRYEDQPCLIEENQLFPFLIRNVEDIKAEPPKFRRCYQGLLRAYFVYPGYEMPTDFLGRKYWQELGKRLYGWLPVLEGGELAQRWINALREHHNLLGPSPCRRYGLSLLNGDTTEFNTVCEKLCLNEETWVPKMAVLGQLEMSANLSDSEFKGKIGRLLDMLSQFQIIRDQGLAAILSRYEKCGTHTEHPGLINMSVSLWGTPWMERNRAHWDARVSESVRVMVTGWMKRRAIKDFFELLSGDGTTDPRRLRFWLRYADAIDDMAFALGKDVQFSNRIDFVRFRNENQGRCMKLEGSTSGNNAFLMLIGRYLLVEFGEKGNALYIYESNRLEISFAAQSTYLSSIKQRDKTTEWLRHADGHMKWEDKFAREIYGLVRIFPNR